MSEYELEQLCDGLEAEIKQLKDENERLRIEKGEILLAEESLKFRYERQAAVAEAAKTHDHIKLLGEDVDCGICKALARLEVGDDD